MAGLLVNAVKSGIATGTSAKTLVQVVAASNHAVKVKRIKVTFAGTSVTAAPILVEVLRQTSAGTMSALTLVKEDTGRGETIQTTAQHTSTSEPTAGDILDATYVHPQAGYELAFATFDECILLPTATRLGVRVTAGADVSAAVVVVVEE